ncbi:MAG: dipeptide epimerase [Eubacteriales bacterium]|nr:dipeptide epimerase [Eubacteriales bacterium]MDD4421620.1 dipeptide epimerase [Eubacteriales bacterium]HBR31757.1 dipeptide epimerase [Clostridiales bacterium]
MFIKNIELLKQIIPLKKPFKTALRQVEFLESYIVRAVADNGWCGYGSASPTAAITGETDASIICAITEYIKPALIGKKLDFSLIDIITASIAYNMSAKAAVETALYDLLSQESEMPLYRYLGGKEERCFKNDITISINSPTEMATDATDALSRGISIIKLKLGSTLQENIERIDAVASVSKKAPLRLDANQSWSIETAIKISDHCVDKGYNIELIEQPFKRHETELMGKFKNISRFPILGDESVFDSHDAKKITDNGFADFINIKLAKCGGIKEAGIINSIAEKAGIRCLMGCMLESPIGIIAAAHFAAANKNITMIDLDATELLEHNPVISATTFTPGEIFVGNSGVGLGIYDIGRTERIA